MDNLSPRPVPVTLQLLPTVVTYSDGEGAGVGLGISVYAPGLPPRAAFVKVPEVVRSLWRLQEQRSAKADIFEIEGIGPLAVAHT